MGCTVFVMGSKLQEWEKRPKWHICSQLGQLWGFSDDNYFFVANIQNLTTGYISPQYHVGFDYLFQKVCGTGVYEVVTNDISNQLFKWNSCCYVEEEFGKDV